MCHLFKRDLKLVRTLIIPNIIYENMIFVCGMILTSFSQVT